MMTTPDNGEQYPTFPRNARGETYGSTENVVGLVDKGPDLILTYGDGGTMGYVRREDFGYNSSGPVQTNRVLPLFASDGISQVGTKSLS